MNRPTMAPVYVGVTSPNREPRGLIDYFHARTNTTEYACHAVDQILLVLIPRAPLK
jgi:hypothetical protein